MQRGRSNNIQSLPLFTFSQTIIVQWKDEKTSWHQPVLNVVFQTYSLDGRKIILFQYVQIIPEFGRSFQLRTWNMNKHQGCIPGAICGGHGVAWLRAFSSNLISCRRNGKKLGFTHFDATCATWWLGTTTFLSETWLWNHLRLDGPWSTTFFVDETFVR